MSGSATLTIVMSISNMNTPVQTAIRVHHFRSTEPPPFLSPNSRYGFILSLNSGIILSATVSEQPTSKSTNGAAGHPRGAEAILAAALELLRERGIAR